MQRSILRSNCFACKFAESRRCGDITLGDFWGLDEKILEQIKIHGYNMIFVNNQEGKNIFKLIHDNITVVERPVKEAINGNDTLKASTNKPEEYDILWQNINKIGFYDAIKVVYNYNWEKEYKILLIWKMLKKIFPPIAPIRRFIIKLLKGEG